MRLRSYELASASHFGFCDKFVALQLSTFATQSAHSGQIVAVPRKIADIFGHVRRMSALAMKTDGVTARNEAPCLWQTKRANDCIQDLDRLQSKRPATVGRHHGPLFLCLSVIARASASIPSRTPAGLAFGGSSHADTINSCPARSASGDDLRDHAVRLGNWRNWHCLY